MNEILYSLYDRRSVRAFEDQPVAEEQKRMVLDAAAQAPSAGCQQLYTILDITDPALKERLAETCDHQSFIARAPVVLIFCADCLKWFDAYVEAGCTPRQPRAGDLLLAVDDALCAAQNAVVAAWALGIGSCYIGDIMERCEEHRALLHLPEYVFPAAMLVFGYPTAQQWAREKPARCPLESIVHENAYRRADGAALRAMLGHKAAAKPWEEWVAAFCRRKYDSGFSREMSRSVAKYLEAYRE